MPEDFIVRTSAQNEKWLFLMTFLWHCKLQYLGNPTTDFLRKLYCNSPRIAYKNIFAFWCCLPPDAAMPLPTQGQVASLLCVWCEATTKGTLWLPSSLVTASSGGNQLWPLTESDAAGDWLHWDAAEMLNHHHGVKASRPTWKDSSRRIIISLWWFFEQNKGVQTSGKQAVTLQILTNSFSHVLVKRDRAEREGRWERNSPY